MQFILMVFFCLFVLFMPIKLWNYMSGRDYSYSKEKQRTLTDRINDFLKD